MSHPPRRRTRRGRTPLPETERKARLIQARVDEELDETLKAEAEKRRVSVSQLIRNVLEDTFRLVDGIVAETVNLKDTVARDARRLAASAKGQPRPTETAAPRSIAEALAAVDAWQEVVLARPHGCARCGTALQSGARGLLAVSSEPVAARLCLCLACSRTL